MKNIFICFIALFIFTEGLIFFHYSKFEKSEYDRICNSLYTEKVWINTCYIPYYKEIQTFNLAINVELAGIILTGICLLYFQKFNLKN